MQGNAINTDMKVPAGGLDEQLSDNDNCSRRFDSVEEKREVLPGKTNVARKFGRRNEWQQKMERRNAETHLTASHRLPESRHTHATQPTGPRKRWHRLPHRAWQQAH